MQLLKIFGKMKPCKHLFPVSLCNKINDVRTLILFVPHILRSNRSWYTICRNFYKENSVLSNLINYEPSNAQLWQGRKDSLPDERFFQKTECIDLRIQDLSRYEPPYVIAGFCSDEGIIRNEGRPGASLGPLSLRTQFAKLACHQNTSLIDVGNIICTDQNLEFAQKEFGQLISHCQQQNKITIAFGGGHDIAWAHYQGLHDHYPRIGIINFDAHFDLREASVEEKGSSGTPFRQIANFLQQQHRPFRYCCIGIQQHANTASLFECAQQLDVATLTADDINAMSFAWQTAFIDQFILNEDYIYLSICLDVFAQCFAPGVSAPQPTGLTSWQVIPLLKYIMQTGKVIALDIAELSPPFDQGDMTARLAAVILAELLNHD